MTGEELEKKAEAYADEHFDDYRMTVGDLENAYIAGARGNGFVRHDLRKNPEDLPKTRGGIGNADIPAEERMVRENPQRREAD